MKIVLTNDAKDIAGGENFVLYLARGLRNSGHTVIIATQEESELSEISRQRGFETFEVAYASHGKEFAGAKALVQALKGKQIDVIHTNSNFDRTVGAFAAWALSCGCVASVHSCLSIQHNITHWLRNRFLIHHIVPDGNSTKAVLMEEDHLPASKITVIHDAIPEDEIQVSEAARIRLRNEWGIADDELVLGNVARLVEFKGHIHLLEAARELAAKGCSFKIVIVGDGDLRISLEEQATSMGLENHVIFTGYRTDLSDLLSAFDVYVQPSIDKGGETFPLSVIAATAAGLPVISSDVGDIHVMVRDNVNGYLISPSDSRLLAANIERLLSSASTRTEFGRNSRIIFEQDLSLTAMVRAFEKVYEKVIR